MRIGRSFGFNFRLLSKEVLTTGLGIFSLALIFTVGYMAVSQRQVSAVVPPNSCFVFDEATGTIMDYGDGPLGGVTGMRTIGTCPASVDIPSQINNTDVKIIADHAFHGKGLTAVNLPATLVEIGDQSFLSNQISGSIVIPDSVVTIKHAAFGINSITSVVLGSSVQFIGDQAFASNQIGGAINIPDSVTTIDWGAFASNQITSVSFGTGLTSIGGVAFGTNKLTSLTIPANITDIQQRAFESNQLASIDLGSVTSIGSGAFSGNRLASVSFAPSLQIIGSNAFYDNSLVHVALPGSVQSIGDGAFVMNQIETVNIAGDINAGASLRLASAFYGNKLTQDQFNALDVSTVRYVAVYTEDTTNPYGYVDESYPYDINGDGSPDLIAGGVVINPSQLNIEYVDSQGNPLHAVERRTGPSLTDYLMTSNTDGIQAGEYYKNNQQLLLSPVAVDGCVAPADKTITLAIDDNTIRFVYYTEAEVLAMQTPTPSVTKSTADTIVVVWSPTEGAVGYTVQYRVKGASEWISGSVSISADTLMYTMYGLALNTEYEIQVIAHQADGASIASPVLSARTNSELSDTGVDATQAILTGSVVAFVGMIVLMYRKKLVS